ncbi:preprotein translocase subunit SecE [Ignavibacteria bacterium]|nr:preprotein translocase subunit SecE [Bacteroidota bacterium]MCZ2132311.1 preprotein translocase subunit SecE [Bacteroidota bacterium]
MVAKIKEYTGEVSKEMKKVSWPTRQQLRESTIVVLATCGIITTFVWVIDFVMTAFVKMLF